MNLKQQDDGIEEKMDLKMVVAIFRHGDRSPATLIRDERLQRVMGMNESERQYFQSQLIPPQLQRTWIRHFPVRFIPQLDAKTKAERYAHLLSSSPLLSTSISDANHSLHLPHLLDKRNGVPNPSLLKQVFGDLKTISVLSSQKRGLLTLRGAWDLQMEGMSLRRRYVDKFKFLPLPDSPDQSPEIPLEELIFARSTCFARTIQSTQNMLVGLLTPDAKTNFLDEGASSHKLLPAFWQNSSSSSSSSSSPDGDDDVFQENPNPGILPIHVRSPEDDTLCPSARFCPALLAKFRQSEFPLIDYPSFDSQAFKTRIRQIFELNQEEKIDFWAIHDHLRCKRRHNLVLPKEITPLLFDRIVRHTSWQVYSTYSDQQTCSLGVGRLLGELYDEMKTRMEREKEEGNKEVGERKRLPRLLLLGGHDTTLMPFLCALKAFNGIWPRYNSVILLELWKEKTPSPSSSSYWVRLIYNGKPLMIAGDEQKYQREGHFLSWNDFASLSLSYVPRNFERDCYGPDCKV